jgi:hypothetical protein
MERDSCMLMTTRIIDLLCHAYREVGYAIIVTIATEVYITKAGGAAYAAHGTRC